jgi:hypothetical protein
MTKERLEIKKNRDKYEVRVSVGAGLGSTEYHNVLDNNPNKIATILLDLEAVSHLPIEKAVKIYLKRKRTGDWMS